MATKIDKETQQYIQVQIDAGVQLQDIYNELSPKFDDKKALAELITRTVSSENKNKYKIWNYVLIGFLLIPFLTIFYISYNLAINGDFWFVFLTPLLFISIYAIYKIYSYKAPFYFIIGIFSSYSLVSTLLSSEFRNESEIQIAISIGVTGFSLFLYYKLFPNYKLRGYPVDENGEYNLTKQTRR